MRLEILDKLQEIQAYYYLIDNSLDEDIKRGEKTVKVPKSKTDIRKSTDKHFQEMTKKLEDALTSCNSEKELQEVMKWLKSNTPILYKSFLMYGKEREKKENIRLAVASNKQGKRELVAVPIEEIKKKTPKKEKIIIREKGIDPKIDRKQAIFIVLEKLKALYDKMNGLDLATHNKEFEDLKNKLYAKFVHAMHLTKTHNEQQEVIKYCYENAKDFTLAILKMADEKDGLKFNVEDEEGETKTIQIAISPATKQAKRNRKKRK